MQAAQIHQFPSNLKTSYRAQYLGCFPPVEVGEETLNIEHRTSNAECLDIDVQRFVFINTNMPFEDSIKAFINKIILIKPVPGFGWLIDGLKHEPMDEHKMPKPFKAVLESVLCEYGMVYAAVAECNVMVEGKSFCWVGLIPVTDGFSELNLGGVNCRLILSSVRPRLAIDALRPKYPHLEAGPGICVRGCAFIVLVEDS